MLPWQHGTHPAPLATASVDSWLLGCVCRNEALPDTYGVLRMMAKTAYHSLQTHALQHLCAVQARQQIEHVYSYMYTAYHDIASECMSHLCAVQARNQIHDI